LNGAEGRPAIVADATKGSVSGTDSASAARLEGEAGRYQDQVRRRAISQVRTAPTGRKSEQIKNKFGKKRGRYDVYRKTRTGL
jgi:hypothetical protein